MSRLYDARDRLEKAVDRLEKALSDSLARDGSDEARLTAELAAARKDYQELSRVTDQVSEKLDVTIDRLKSVVEA